MIKKIFLTSFIALSVGFLAGCSNAKPVPKDPRAIFEIKAPKCANLKQAEKDNEFLTLLNSSTTAKNRYWVGTFQLVFNEMKKELLRVSRVKFVDEDETIELKGLNDELFNKDMLQESSYYLSYGDVSFEAKEKIKKGIKEKFNETSDILDKADWTPVPPPFRRYYAYAMLKKEFSFLYEFDILTEDSFNNSKEKFKYFGIDSKSKSELYRNVRVLFYNNKDDYAIQLLTKEQDIIYLYRTNRDDDFKTLYDKMMTESKEYNGDRYFKDIDTLKVPNLKIALQKEYPWLLGKTIEGTDGMNFSFAIETLKFELDNKGGKIKSEALVMAEDNAIMLEEPKIIPRHFNFDKTFNLFLVDKDKHDPYAAIRVEDLKPLQQ